MKPAPTDLHVRIGIHTGLVVIGEIGSSAKREMLALGESPNLAARVQGVAEPDTVVMSAATQRLVHGLFECQDLGPQTLKGLSVPVSVYRVSSAVACVTGEARGVLKGDFLSTITSITPAPNVALTSVYFVTATLVLYTRTGDLTMEENAASNQNPSQGDLGDVVTIVSGTDKWTGATGHLRVWGNLSPTVSDVTYEGEVCLP